MPEMQFSCAGGQHTRKKTLHKGVHVEELGVCEINLSPSTLTCSVLFLYCYWCEFLLHILYMAFKTFWVPESIRHQGETSAELLSNHLETNAHVIVPKCTICGKENMFSDSYFFPSSSDEFHYIVSNDNLTTCWCSLMDIVLYLFLTPCTPKWEWPTGSF